VRGGPGPIPAASPGPRVGVGVARGVPPKGVQVDRADRHPDQAEPAPAALLTGIRGTPARYVGADRRLDRPLAIETLPVDLDVADLRAHAAADPEAVAPVLTGHRLLVQHQSFARVPEILRDVYADPDGGGGGVVGVGGRAFTDLRPPRLDVDHVALPVQLDTGSIVIRPCAERSIQEHDVVDTQADARPGDELARVEPQP